MKIDFIPKSRLGKWAVRLGITSVVLTALSLLFAIAIRGDSAIIAGNPLLSILSVALSVAFSIIGPFSFFVGIFTIIKHKEWSVGVSLAALYGLALLIFLLGEFLFPH